MAMKVGGPKVNTGSGIGNPSLDVKNPVKDQYGKDLVTQYHGIKNLPKAIEKVPEGWSKFGKKIGIGGGGGGPNIDTPQGAAPVTAPTYNPNAVTAPTIQAANFNPTQQFVDPTQQAQFRQAQMGLMNQLQTQAAGGGPSLAGEQLRMGNEQAIAAQQAAMASQRGGFNPALARQSQQQMAQIQGGEAAKAAQLRMQEQLNAQQALGQLAGQGRGQDIGLATTNAQLGQANQQLGADLAMQQAGLQGQADISAMQGGVDIAALELQAAQGNQNAVLALEKLKLDRSLGQAEIDAERQKNKNNLLGGVLGTVGTMVAASDVRVKKDIKDDPKAMREFIAAAKGYDYKYKDGQKHGEGSKHSPMAQSLAKTKLGKDMIVEAPDGTKMVDYSKTFGVMLSALNDMDKRIKKAEKK